jgi:putative methionine-R-sulfoxide reductase with GAF domain
MQSQQGTSARRSSASEILSLSAARKYKIPKIQLPVKATADFLVDNPLASSPVFLVFRWLNLESDYVRFALARSASRQKTRWVGALTIMAAFAIALSVFTAMTHGSGSATALSICGFLIVFMIALPCLALSMHFTKKDGRERMAERWAVAFSFIMFGLANSCSFVSQLWFSMVSVPLAIVQLFVHVAILNHRFMCFVPIVTVNIALVIGAYVYHAATDHFVLLCLLLLYVCGIVATYLAELLLRKYFLIQSPLVAEILQDHDEDATKGGDRGDKSMLSSRLTNSQDQMRSANANGSDAEMVAAVGFDRDRRDTTDSVPVDKGERESHDVGKDGNPAHERSSSDTSFYLPANNVGESSSSLLTTTTTAAATGDNGTFTFGTPLQASSIHGNSTSNLLLVNTTGNAQNPPSLVITTGRGSSGAMLVESGHEIRQALAMSRALNDVAMAIGSVMELQRVLQLIMDKSKLLMRCEASSLMLVDEKTQELVFSIATGSRGSAMKEFRFPIGKGIAGYVAMTGEPLLVPDAYADPRFNKEADKRSGFVTRSILCVPLLIHGKILGVVQVINSIRKPCFDEADAHTLISLAAHAAIAIENARLYDELRNKAVELQNALEKERSSTLAKYRSKSNLLVPSGSASGLGPSSSSSSSGGLTMEIAAVEDMSFNGSVIIVGIESFSSLITTSDDVVLMKAVSAYHSTMATCVEHYGGSLMRLSGHGDALLAYFSAVKFPSNHVVRALAAALEMHQASENVGLMWRKTVPNIECESFCLQTGLDSGRLLIHYRNCCFGEAVYGAQRLQLQARAGEVLVSQKSFEEGALGSVLVDWERLRIIHQGIAGLAYVVRQDRNLQAVWKTMDVRAPAEAEAYTFSFKQHQSQHLMSAMQPQQSPPQKHSHSALGMTMNHHGSHTQQTGSQDQQQPKASPEGRRHSDTAVERSIIESIANETIIGREARQYGSHEDDLYKYEDD